MVFVLEQTPLAHCFSKIPEDVPRYTTDYLCKQNEAILDRLKTIAEMSCAIHNEIKGHREAVTTLTERLQQPILVYHVPNSYPITQKDVDELLNSIDTADERWLSQEEYADAIGCKVSTLRKYREKKNGARFHSKNPLMGQDKAGHIFLKRGSKETMYLLRR